MNVFQIVSLAVLLVLSGTQTFKINFETIFFKKENILRNKENELKLEVENVKQALEEMSKGDSLTKSICETYHIL